MKAIVVRFGEIHLKGKNRPFFENLLKTNIKNALGGLDVKVCFARSRFLVEFDQSEQDEVLRRLSKVFGIHSFSIADIVPTEMESLKALVASHFVGGTFKVEVNRADKAFPIKSPELCRIFGGAVLDAHPSATVDVHNPQSVISVDIRENGTSYVFCQRILGQGGMPVGSAGRGLLMLSGGIDSPVAGFLMAKRGLRLDAIHFHSHPYTSQQALDKVQSLAKRLAPYAGNINLHVIGFTKIQEAIHSHCNDRYMITLIRRAMMTIAEQVAKASQCGCIINGESLGQVASQTLDSITVTNANVADLPIFRPLIGFDKSEIVDIAKRIDTYETSILPFEDCCTVFLPEYPATRPELAVAQAEEAKIPDYQTLITQAIASKDVIKIKPDWTI